MISFVTQDPQIGKCDLGQAYSPKQNESEGHGHPRTILRQLAARIAKNEFTTTQPKLGVKTVLGGEQWQLMQSSRSKNQPGSWSGVSLSLNVFLFKSP